MITINKEVLKEFKPCAERWNNYLEHYSEFNGSLDEFLDLELLSYDDKMWVAKKVLNRNQLVHFAVLCAQSILNIYENKYPNDKRISDLISFMVTITDFSNLTTEQELKLRELRIYAAAATDAAYAAATDAVDAAYAAYAAAATVCAAYAVDAAYTATATADAAYAAATTDAGRKNQQELNLKFLKIVSES